MSQKPIGEKAMTATERQRRRRARLRGEKPPQKPWRPQNPWHKPSALEIFLKKIGKDPSSAHRKHANDLFESFGRQLLGIEDLPGCNYSPENAKRFEPLARKGILEQFGRHAVFLGVVVGCDTDEIEAELRKLAEDFLIDVKKNGKIYVADAVWYFRWLREVRRHDNA